MHSAFSCPLTGADREQGVQRNASGLGKRPREAAQSFFTKKICQKVQEKSLPEKQLGLNFWVRLEHLAMQGSLPGPKKELSQDQDSSCKGYKAGRCRLLYPLPPQASVTPSRKFNQTISKTGLGGPYNWLTISH